MSTKPNKDFPTIGDMNKRLAYQTFTKVDDGGGGGVKVWATSFSFFGDVTVPTILSGAKQAKEADKERPEVTYNIKTRYIPGFTNAGRIIYGDLFLKVLTANPIDEEKRYMKIVCVARPGGSI